MRKFLDLVMMTHQSQMTHQKNEKYLFRVIGENYDTIICSKKILNFSHLGRC